MTREARAPDAVVVSHHVHALGVQQVAVVYEEAEDAPAAEPELLSDHTLQIRHHATRVQVHEQPALPGVHHRGRRVVEEDAHADRAVTVSSHDGYRTGTTPNLTPKHRSGSTGNRNSISHLDFQDKSVKSVRPQELCSPCGEVH